MWSHDVNVERGKTYRYRVSLVLNNPIFGQNAALDKSQVELAKNPLVRTAPSEWSEPLHVDPEDVLLHHQRLPRGRFRGVGACLG